MSKFVERELSEMLNLRYKSSKFIPKLPTIFEEESFDDTINRVYNKKQELEKEHERILNIVIKAKDRTKILGLIRKLKKLQSEIDETHSYFEHLIGRKISKY